MQTDSSQTIVCNHFVCLIDLLGQSDKLENWGELPLGGHASPEFMQKIRETAGAILRLHGYIHCFVREENTLLKKSVNLEPYRKECTPEKFSELEAKREYILNSQKLRIQTISDSIILWAPCIRPDKSYGAIVDLDPLSNMVLLCAAHSLYGLACSIPLRGGLAVGLGLQNFDCGFYGPALLDAHKLEKQAGWPRILVSEKIHDWLNIDGVSLEKKLVHEQTHFESEINKLNNSHSRNIVDWLYRTDDGLTAVDFAGHAMSEFFRQVSENSPELFQNALQFARDEHERFTKEGNDKLVRRYGELLTYLESRAEYWK